MRLMHNRSVVAVSSNYQKPSIFTPENLNHDPAFWVWGGPKKGEAWGWRGGVVLLEFLCPASNKPALSDCTFPGPRSCKAILAGGTHTFPRRRIQPLSILFGNGGICAGSTLGKNVSFYHSVRTGGGWGAAPPRVFQKARAIRVKFDSCGCVGGAAPPQPPACFFSRAKARLQICILKRSFGQHVM